MRISIASLLKRWRVPYLLLLAALTAFFGYHCLYSLEVEKDNRSMDADDVGQTLVDQEFERLFGRDDSILLAVHKKLGIIRVDDEIKVVATLVLKSPAAVTTTASAAPASSTSKPAKQ